jgi:hypothetical protein
LTSVVAQADIVAWHIVIVESGLAVQVAVEVSALEGWRTPARAMLLAHQAHQEERLK